MRADTSTDWAPVQFNGDPERRDDGYVYDVNGGKLGKWYRLLHVEGRDGEPRIWPPRLEDLARAERLYWKLNQRQKLRVSPEWQRVHQAIVDAGHLGKRYYLGESKLPRQEYLAHAVARHDKEDGWWLVRVSQDRYGQGWSHAFDWVKPPEEPIHLELGQALYEFYFMYCYRSFWPRRTLARDFLNHLFVRHLKTQLPPPISESRLHHFHVNGRDYWYNVYTPNDHDVIYSSTAWATDHTSHHGVTAAGRPEVLDTQKSGHQ